MAGPFGVTFAPTDDDDPAAQQALGGGRRQQAAVKVLSLMPPAQYSPRAFAPNALLQAPGAAGGGIDPNKAVVASILRTLLGPDIGLPNALPTEVSSLGSVSAVRNMAPGAPRIREPEGGGREPVPSPPSPPADADALFDSGTPDMTFTNGPFAGDRSNPGGEPRPPGYEPAISTGQPFFTPRKRFAPQFGRKMGIEEP